MHQCSESGMHGKVALVTGSSDENGIGIAIATSLARRGCSVVLTGSRNPEKAETLRSKLERQFNVQVLYFAANFEKLEEIERLYDDVIKCHPEGVDILVNNAGYMYCKSVESMDMDQWEKSLRINVTAPCNLTKLTLPKMRSKGWGRIINISSISGLSGFADLGAYVASKHALCGLTKTVAMETIGTGITCNAICPAEVLTELNMKLAQGTYGKEGMTLNEYKKTAVPQANPSGRFVETGQVAELVIFLCSSAADQMTGTNIPMDAGHQAQ
ncbi:D-beta-hydroxybutyrate dehydrogenase-like [Ptychodera flava]|uniref:D-beta-hydroxybutyrate dehydrogenase-like n=1 Tax=Ptychodera flava TaxID=63121 RepID=UPI00396A5616